MEFQLASPVARNVLVELTERFLNFSRLFQCVLGHLVGLRETHEPVRKLLIETRQDGRRDGQQALELRARHLGEKTLGPRGLVCRSSGDTLQKRLSANSGKDRSQIITDWHTVKKTSMDRGCVKV